jgi:general secretion pathway protein G
MMVLRARGSMSMRDLQEDEVCVGIRGNKLTGSTGFTLIEILIGIGIVAVLTTIAYPFYTEHLEKARIVRAIAEIKDISERIDLYQLDTSAYPETLDAVNYATLLDPWESSYQYLNIQTATGKGAMRKEKFLVPINTDYDLYSMGKDGKTAPALTAKASKDDIIRANNGGYIGLASEF